jgi:hypothetical protein
MLAYRVKARIAGPDDPLDDAGRLSYDAHWPDPFG